MRFDSRRWRTLLFVAGIVLTGCKKVPVVTAPPLEEDALVQTIRSRPVPDPAQAKFSIKIHSRPLGITAPPLAGGLIVDRPGRAYITVLLPTGSPVVTLTTDGTRASMTNARDRQFITVDNAAELLGGATGNAISLDDITQLLLGLLPVSSAHVRSKDILTDGVQFVFDGPAGTVITAMVDPLTGTPRSVSLDDAKGRRTVVVTYEPFEPLEDGTLVPSRVSLRVEAVELELDIRFKSWTVPSTVPDVFSPSAPAGYTVMTMAEYSQQMADKLKERSDEGRD